MKEQRMFLVVLLGISAAVLGSTSSWAGKPKPPQPPPDPAVAFVLTKFGAGGDLMVMNADGSNQTLVLAGGRNFAHHQPNWSPDGTQLVFMSNIEGNGVYVINRDGTGRRKVVALNIPAGDFLGSVWSPVPAPDGQFKIAYADQGRNPADGTLWPDTDLFLVNLDGSGRIQFTNTRTLSEDDPTWSPLATRLAAQVLVDETFAADVVVYDLGLTAGNVVTVVSSTNLTATGTLSDFFVQSPDWAKTQDKLTVVAVGEGTRDIWLIDLGNPDNPVNLLATPLLQEWTPSWSFDDSKIAFQRDWDIYVMDADGTGVTKVATPAKGKRFVTPDWRRNP